MNEILKRFAEGLDLCDGEHTLIRVEDQEEPEEEIYRLTCDAKDLELGVLAIPKTSRDASDEIRYFVSSNLSRHREEVLREALQGQMRPKPGGVLEDLLYIGQTTNDTLKRVQSIMDMQRDRIAVLEAAVEEQGNRLTTAEQRIQGRLAL